jgi:hypothetical protein
MFNKLVAPIIEFFLVIMLLVVLFATGCNKKDVLTETNLWRSEIPPIEKRLPLIVPIESCIWQGGEIPSKGGRLSLPAPSEYFVLGYTKITDKVKNIILEKYDWQDVQITSYSLKRPADNVLVEEFLASNEFKVSFEFNKDHDKSCAYWVKIFIFSPESNIVYFDLLKG